MGTLTGNESGMIMPVQPLNNGYSYPVAMPYGGNGGGLFGGNGDSWLGILFLIALCNGGWGGFGGFGGGYGAMMGMGMMDGMALYPWMNQAEITTQGFQNQQISTQINGIQNAITSGFGDVQLGIAGVNQSICQTGSNIQNAVNQGFASTNLGMCQGFNGVNTAISGAQNAISQQLNTNEIANLNRSFAEQTANSQGFNSVNTGVADLRYTVATEACADRAAVGDALQNITMQNMGSTNQIVNAITAGIQSIKDDLCADRLDAERRENQNLRTQLNMAQLAASQTAQTARLLENNNAQTALFQQGLNSEVDALYNRLQSCPVNTVPVYGSQPIFTCNGGGCPGNF